MRPEDRRRLAPRLAAIALVIAAICAVVGWIYTARKLNALAAYQPVGAQALRAAETARGADERNIPPKLTQVGYRVP